MSTTRSIDAREPRLAYLVKWVERGLRLRLDEALSAHGTTTPEYTALSVLRERDELSSAQLARRVFVTPQAMHQLVTELEQKKLIRRKVSKNHRRKMLVSLTAKGRRLLEQCDRETLPIEEHLLANLSRSDAATLRRALAQCAEALSTDEPGESRQAAAKGARGTESQRSGA